MIKINISENIANNSKWVLFPLLVFLISCSTDDEPSEPPEPPVVTFVEYGWDDISSGSFEGAMENFNDALEIDPGNVPASIGKAWCMLFIDSGQSLEEMEILFQMGISDTTWSADAQCGLSIVNFAQGNYTTAIAYVDSLLSIDPFYVLEYFDDIDYNDLLIVKAQSQFMEQDYSGANMTLSQISPSLYLDDSQESWEVNGVIYLTFESALSALIALVTQQYDSGGYISNT